MQPDDPKKFTEEAWEAIVISQQVARRSQHQVLEVEHLLMSLLEQEEGLTTTIFASLSVPVAKARRQVEEFMRRKPRVASPKQLYLGRSFEIWLDRAEESRKVFDHDFMGVEHLLLSLADEERLGKRLFRDLSIDPKKLEKVIYTFMCSPTIICQNSETKYEESDKFKKLQNLQQLVPIISDRALVDLINWIQINQELILFRQNRGFIGRLFDGIMGRDHAHLVQIHSNLNAGIQSLNQCVLALSDNLRISNVALEITQTKLLEARKAISNHRQELELINQITNHLQLQLNDHEQRIHNLEQRVYRIEVIQKIDTIIAAWQSRRTYQGFHWTLQIAFVVREVVDFAIADYEFITGDFQLRQKVIDQLIIANPQIPDNSFSLISLLDIAHQETSVENRELAQSLLEVRSLHPNRLVKMPHLFILGTTLELAGLSQEALPKSPAKTAFELCCRDLDMICLATDKKEFVGHIVNETAYDRYLFRNSF